MFLCASWLISSLNIMFIFIFIYGYKFCHFICHMWFTFICILHLVDIVIQSDLPVLSTVLVC